MVTDRGTEYCGKAETHDYQLYLALNAIEHTKTRTRPTQTNGICERFQKAILQELYQVAFRKKLYLSLEELQKISIAGSITTTGSEHIKVRCDVVVRRCKR